jgi:hypothetical protein
MKIGAALAGMNYTFRPIVAIIKYSHSFYLPTLNSVYTLGVRYTGVLFIRCPYVKNVLNIKVYFLKILKRYDCNLK